MSTVIFIWRGLGNFMSSLLEIGPAILQSFKNYILSAYYVLGNVLNTGYTKQSIHPQGTYIWEQTDSKQVGHVVLRTVERNKAGKEKRRM